MNQPEQPQPQQNIFNDVQVEGDLTVGNIDASQSSTTKNIEQNHSGSGDNVFTKNVNNIYPPAPPPPLTSIPQNLRHSGTQTFVERDDELDKITQFFDESSQIAITSAFQLSDKRLSPQAQELGCYLSLFKAETFAWQWVIDSNLFADKQDKKAIRELQKLRDKELRKFSLLEIVQEEEQTQPLFSYHPLIARYFANKLSQSNKLEKFKVQFCEVMAQLTKLIEYNPTKKQVDEFSIMVPHLITVVTEMIEKIKDDDLFSYFNSLGNF